MYVCHCMSVTVHVFVSEGLCAEGWCKGGNSSCGADVHIASRASWMATVVRVTGKRVGGLSYALQSSEWLEFNMVEKTSSCRLTGNNVSFLLLVSISITLTLSSWDMNYCPSVNTAEISIVLNVLLWCKSLKTKNKQANWNIFHTVIQLIKNIIHNLLKERNNLDSLEGMIDLKWKCYDWSIDLLSDASALFKSRHAASPRGPWSSGFRATHRSIHLQCGYQDTERQDEPASSVLLDICPIGRRSRCLVKNVVTERLFTSLTLASPGILFSDET